MVIQLHDCGRNVCPFWGQDGFGTVHKCLWSRRPCGKLGQVQGGYVLRHIILECIVPNYATISVRNFLKSCKGRSSRLETLFQCGFLTVTWERFLNNATHRKESLLRLNISSPRADHSVPTNFHSLQNYSTAKHCSKQGF